jgi:hypothetical protein
MTQLDSVTWLPQIIWLFIIFSVLYTIIYKNYGPLAYYHQGLRAKKVEKHYRSIVFYDFLNVSCLSRVFKNVSSTAL